MTLLRSFLTEMRSHTQNLILADKAYRMAKQSMDFEVFAGGEIDEIALLFDGPDLLEDFVKWGITEGGLEHFNSVPWDKMWRQDTAHEEWFDVRFEFLRKPGIPWRIEATCVLAGHAPLHSAVLEKYGNGTPIHASWKAYDKPAYDRTKKELSQVFPPGLPSIPFFAEYRNSYGMFSYWGGPDLYFKPRVNLRDP